MRRALMIVLRCLIVLIVTVLFIVGTFYAMIFKFKNGPSESAKNLFITTIMESGQLKFVAKMVCTPEEIEEIVAANSMKEMEGDVDASLINIKPNKDNDTSDPATNPTDENTNPTDSNQSEQQTPVEEEVFDANGIRLEEIVGRTFYAKMLIVKNPEQVCISSIYPWKDYGEELNQLVDRVGGVAGINGGIYESMGNTGGQPLGVVVQQGQITYNAPYNITGCYMIGFNNDNILIIKSIDGMSPGDFENYVATAGIRDAIAFQDEASDSDNHFVPLILNGEARQLGGTGSGANPRTVIGQRADGAVLMLVTDGRGASGHLGATASDLIGIMQEYGAVNAANLDGGSSSTMYYNGNWEMTSVTFYYQNSSWKLPTAFAVLPAK